ncbi:hypothetical protein FSB78_11170 [Sphingomonas ginsenosidivorax]|uniref:Uncharacterized protein n=1 Tax=Sphingomonas ginsenosidivorax TaxID=862135 RepID=A0A5C6UFD8_9SPHN|nr:hypothetical protein [Sphingomonas ginsenosidivorax]TXC71439.1 hypothetical protein FSB78_11170 [Sphingomonas ginsenosidivorax]
MTVDTPPSLHRILPRTDPLPVILVTGTAILVEAIFAGGPKALLADLALIAVVVAAGERRYTAMLIAAGLACGLVAYGAMLLPVAIGVAIRRRVRAPLLLLTPVAAAATAMALGAMPLPDGRGMIGLAAITPDGAADGLLLAVGIGASAWVTASLTTRSLHGRALISTATMVALGAALVIQQTSMAIPVALAVLAPDRRVLAAVVAASALAASALPLAATLALVTALILLWRPHVRSAANDNPRLAVLR